MIIHCSLNVWYRTTFIFVGNVIVHVELVNSVVQQQVLTSKDNEATVLCTVFIYIPIPGVVFSSVYSHEFAIAAILLLKSYPSDCQRK